MGKSRVLFVCIHNSARSQMAEAFLNHRHGDLFEAESAGLEPGTINPLAIQTMAEAGIDISHKNARDVFAVYKSGRIFSYVITVCDEANAERCPIFPGVTHRLHWSFPDPAALVGTEAEKREAIRSIRDSIRERIDSWVYDMRNDPVPSRDDTMSSS